MATSLSIASNGITFQDNTTLSSGTISASQVTPGPLSAVSISFPDGTTVTSATNSIINAIIFG